MKLKSEIEMKLLEKNGIRIEIEFFFRMEITLPPCKTSDTMFEAASYAVSPSVNKAAL